MTYHYKAFISYKHDPVDSQIASEIQTRLERFRIPSALKKEKQIRDLRPVFRDKEELSVTDDLNDTIKQALISTEYLIVICSTRSIHSIWVAREIEFFLAHHEQSKVLTVLVDGEPEEVIPKVLCEREVTKIDSEGNPVTVTEPIEPLSCDYRMERRRARREEFPRLAAALIGCRYNDLRQRQRQHQLRLMGAGLAVLAGLMAYFIWSNIQIKDNLKQARINQSRQLADLSGSKLEENDRLLAARLALEALPGKNNDRPVIYEAAYALSQAEGAYNYPDAADIELEAFYPSRYQAYAFKVSSDLNYMAMQDSRYLLRFFNLQTREEIGEAELEREEIYTENLDFTRSAQLAVMDSNVLLVSCGNRLFAYSMETAELIWSQFYEDEILTLSVLGKSDTKDPDLALIFSDHVLVIGSAQQDIRGRYDSGREDIPFAFRTDHPYTYTSYNYGESEAGHSYYFDREAQKLYVVSRSGFSSESRAVTGVLMIDAKEQTSAFYPVSIDCWSQFAFFADEDGFWFAAAMNQGDYNFNSEAVDNSYRARYAFRTEGSLTVIHADTKGKIRWEKKIPYQGTTMLGHIALIRYRGSGFEDFDGSWLIGAVFSNQGVFLDPSTGAELAVCRTKSEIADVSVDDSETSILDYTVDGEMGTLFPETSRTGDYTVFPGSVRRGTTRTPKGEDNRNYHLILLGDGVRVYRAEEGDREYTSFEGEHLSEELVTESLAGQSVCIFNMGGDEIAALDLEENTIRSLDVSDLGIKNSLSLLYLDPEETFLLVTGTGEKKPVIERIDLADLSHTPIEAPGLENAAVQFGFETEPVCEGGLISYMGVYKPRTGESVFCLVAYDIQTGEWKQYDLDFDMLDLMLDPPLSVDGSSVLVTDEWENGYLISTQDGSVKTLTDKIPDWDSLLWKEDGTAFALIRSDAEKEHILVYNPDGKEIARIGRDFIKPLSLYFYGKSLWVLYEDYLVCEYDAATGKMLRSISAGSDNSVYGEIYWHFTEDKELILNIGGTGAQIDLELGGRIARIGDLAACIPSRNQMIVRCDADDGYSFVSYSRYTVDDLIRKGWELVGDMNLTEDQRRTYALE